MDLVERSSGLLSAALSTRMRNPRAWNVSRSSSEFPSVDRPGITDDPRGMQDCFRQHPEMYGSELEDDEDELEDELLARENAPSGDGENAPPSPSTQSAPPVAQKTTDPSEPKRVSEESPHDSQRAKPASTQTDDNSKEDADSQTSGEKDDELIPKAAHDATRK
jgi:intermembrane space import and assembly protein 40